MSKKLFLSIVVAVPLLAQSPAPPKPQPELPDTPNQILTELRSIRETLNRTFAAQVELLLSVDRSRIAYQIMITRSEKLESVRGEMALVHSSLLAATRASDTLESQINQAFDPELKANIERQLKEQKALVVEHQERETELRGNEARLQRDFQDAQVSMEQASARLAAIAVAAQRDIISTTK